MRKTKQVIHYFDNGSCFTLESLAKWKNDLVAGMKAEGREVDEAGLYFEIRTRYYNYDPVEYHDLAAVCTVSETDEEVANRLREESRLACERVSQDLQLLRDLKAKYDEVG